MTKVTDTLCVVCFQSTGVSCTYAIQAVVRAMDTVADFAKKKNPSANITKFVIAGASKVITVHSSSTSLMA